MMYSLLSMLGTHYVIMTWEMFLSGWNGVFAAVKFNAGDTWYNYDVGNVRFSAGDTWYYYDVGNVCIRCCQIQCRGHMVLLWCGKCQIQCRGHMVLLWCGKCLYSLLSNSVQGTHGIIMVWEISVFTAVKFSAGDTWYYYDVGNVCIHCCQIQCRGHMVLLWCGKCQIQCRGHMVLLWCGKCLYSLLSNSVQGTHGIIMMWEMSNSVQGTHGIIMMWEMSVFTAVKFSAGDTWYYYDVGNVCIRCCQIQCRGHMVLLWCGKCQIQYRGHMVLLWCGKCLYSLLSNSVQGTHGIIMVWEISVFTAVKFSAGDTWYYYDVGNVCIHCCQIQCRGHMVLLWCGKCQIQCRGHMVLLWCGKCLYSLLSNSVQGTHGIIMMWEMSNSVQGTHGIIMMWEMSVFTAVKFSAGDTWYYYDVGNVCIHCCQIQCRGHMVLLWCGKCQIQCRGHMVLLWCGKCLYSLLSNSVQGTHGIIMMWEMSVFTAVKFSAGDTWYNYDVGNVCIHCCQIQCRGHMVLLWCGKCQIQCRGHMVLLWCGKCLYSLLSNSVQGTHGIIMMWEMSNSVQGTHGIIMMWEMSVFTAVKFSAGDTWYYYDVGKVCIRCCQIQCRGHMVLLWCGKCQIQYRGHMVLLWCGKCLYSLLSNSVQGTHGIIMVWEISVFTAVKFSAGDTWYYYDVGNVCIHCCQIQCRGHMVLLWCGKCQIQCRGHMVLLWCGKCLYSLLSNSVQGTHGIIMMWEMSNSVQGTHGIIMMWEMSVFTAVKFSAGDTWYYYDVGNVCIHCCQIQCRGHMVLLWCGKCQIQCRGHMVLLWCGKCLYSLLSNSLQGTHGIIMMWEMSVFTAVKFSAGDTWYNYDVGNVKFSAGDTWYYYDVGNVCIHCCQIHCRGHMVLLWCGKCLYSLLSNSVQGTHGIIMMWEMSNSVQGTHGIIMMWEMSVFTAVKFSAGDTWYYYDVGNVSIHCCQIQCRGHMV